MNTPSTSSATDKPAPYRESLNVKEQFVHWGKQQRHQNDLSFCCDILPAEAIDKVYPTISQIALPGIMRDEVLSAYQVFMYDCTSANDGRSFCLGMQPNGFRKVKTLRRTTHLKVPTAPKVPKNKKKKQKDEWNK
uniref:Uncharacterized protein n=1 Tax=Romanomermis culicivorax TaxID=13658 RepID=A0A915JQX1_ROMCU